MKNPIKVFLINMEAEKPLSIIPFINSESIELYGSTATEGLKTTTEEFEKILGVEAIKSDLLFVDLSEVNADYEGFKFLNNSTAEIVVFIGSSSFLTAIQVKIGYLKSVNLRITPIKRGKIGMINFELKVELID